MTSQVLRRDDLGSAQGGDGGQRTGAQTMLLDYSCYDHGVIDQGETLLEHDRPKACPVCEGPLFAALNDALPSRHRPHIDGADTAWSRRPTRR